MLQEEIRTKGIRGVKGVTNSKIHLSFQILALLLSSKRHWQPLKSQGLASQVPFQVYDGFGPSLESKKLDSGKYLAL